MNTRNSASSIDMALTEDGQLLIAGHRLDAAATGDLIERLAQLRAQMHPPVPREWAPGQGLDVTNEPALKVGRTPDHTVLLAIRHDGFGWCGFDFAPETAAVLRDMLARHTEHLTSRLIEARTEGGAH